MTKEAFIQVKRATVEQWLEALDLAQALLEKSNHHSKILDAYTAIKEALAQPAQEPMAYGMWDTMIGYGGRMMSVRLDKGQDGCTVPLYTAPPQPAQEPVAWMYDWFCDGKLITGWIAHSEPEIPKSMALNIRPLYTAPPQRTWVGLTEEDFQAICKNFRVTHGGWIDMLALEIETKLKEKNT